MILDHPVLCRIPDVRRRGQTMCVMVAALREAVTTVVRWHCPLRTICVRAVGLQETLMQRAHMIPMTIVMLVENVLEYLGMFVCAA